MALKGVMENEGKVFVPVCPSTVCDWLKRLFGHGSPEYTTLQPHKTDACAECEQLRGDILSLQKPIDRHMLQRGDMTLERMQEIQQLKDDMKYCESALHRHKLEASIAMDKYKAEVSGASSRFSDMSASFRVALNEGTSASPARRREIALKFSREASGFRF